jgi:uncharacterized membrane protein
MAETKSRRIEVSRHDSPRARDHREQRQLATRPVLGAEDFPMTETNQSSARTAPTDGLAKKILRVVLAFAMMSVGILHFTSPEPFVRIVPAILPAPLALVYLSGIAEFAGGFGILIPTFRRAAGWGLIALYIAVFPANINMALNHLPLGNDPVPLWTLWMRLPFQFVFMAWAYWVAVARTPMPQRDGT